MDALTLFGFCSVFAMMVLYWAEIFHTRYIFLFAVACACSAYYAYLQHSLPFCVAETVWTFVALRKWYLHRKRESLK